MNIRLILYIIGQILRAEGLLMLIPLVTSLCYREDGDLRGGIEEMFRFTGERGTTRGMVQETLRNGNTFPSSWRPVRPIPSDDDFFENVWRVYRENGNVY